MVRVVSMGLEVDVGLLLRFNASPTYPLLPITVFQVVDSAIIPVEPDAHQVTRQEAIFCQDDKVGEETTEGLDHPWGKEAERRVRLELGSMLHASPTPAETITVACGLLGYLA